MTSKQKVSIVTGSSSGMGLETSLILARNGFYTYATMRKLDGEGSKELNDISKKENLPLQVIRLDVNDDKSANEAIGAIVKEKDRIDLVVNNAGYDLMGALEETSLDEIKAQFETNFLELSESCRR
jgi:NAD(P)-dependent dehydrogenase (short-subunit alcohol dehydrogenase family)